MLQSLPEEVRWELLEVNFRSLQPVVLSFPIIGYFLSQVLQSAPPERLGDWQLALALVTALTLLLCYAFQFSNRCNYRLWSLLRVLNAALNGLTFGLAGIWLIVPEQPTLQLYVVVVITGSAAAAVISSSSYFPALILYLTTAVVPLGLQAFWTTEEGLAGIARLVPLFWIVFLGVGWRSYLVQRRSGLLAHQNQRLIAQLTLAQFNLEEANRSLNVKVEERTRDLSRFKVLLDAVSEGIVVAKAAGLELVDWNRPALQLLGLEEARPARIDQIKLLADFNWEFQRSSQSPLRLEANEQQPMEVVAWSQTFAEELYLVLVVRDCSVRLNLEKQLLNSQKVEVVGQLAGGLAHDFNNMLAVVMGMSEYLISTFDESDPRRGDVSDILQTARRGQDLTGKLLRLSHSKLDTTESMDLNEQIRDLTPMLRRSLLGGVELLVILAEQPVVVEFVPGDIEQILLNLAVNASDAMPTGGTFTIQLGLDENPDSLPPGGYASLEVSDTGVGMTPAVLSKAFEPFFSTKREKGHGLGLAVIEHIVRRAGGVMRAESRPAVGTRFRIWLPLSKRARTPQKDMPRPVAADRATGTSILLVEDQDGLRSLLERQLSFLGYSVTSARSSEEALNWLERQSFDLLLSDIILPGMSGVDLARRVQSSIPRTLLMSGYADEEPVLNGKPIPLLKKPFRVDELARRLSELRERKLPR